MARPKKQTVDYFPHDCDCSNKKTLFILEQKYGNNGYAFWFKLLEILGSTEGHIIDCNNSVSWQFLQAKTLTTEDICKEMLDLLVDVGAIDRDLWKQKHIWCDNFIERISHVYHNRKVEIPQKPMPRGITTSRNPSQVGITTNINPHSIVKYSKVKNSIVKKRESKRFTPPSLDEIKNYITENNFSVSADTFYKYFNAGNWIDSKGAKVKNWKQKLITWESKNNGQVVDVTKAYNPENPMNDPYIDLKLKKQREREASKNDRN